MNTGILYKLASLMDRHKIGAPMRRLWQLDTLSPHLSYYNNHAIRFLADRCGYDYVTSKRMRTYDISSIGMRLDAVDVEGMTQISKIIYKLGLYAIFPFMSIIPPDLKTYYFIYNGK